MTKRILIVICAVVLAVGVFFAGVAAEKAFAKPELTEKAVAVVRRINGNTIELAGTDYNYYLYRDGKFFSLKIGNNVKLDDSIVGKMVTVWFAPDYTAMEGAQINSINGEPYSDVVGDLVKLSV